MGSGICTTMITFIYVGLCLMCATITARWSVSTVESHPHYTTSAGTSREDDAEDKTFWMNMAQQTLKDVLTRTRNNYVAKNVIFFLGDGMGVSTVTAARIYKGQKAGRSGEETQFAFETFPSVGLSKTYNVDRQTPDSAGTGTAYMCGVKTNLGTLGVDSRVDFGNCTYMNNPDVIVKSILSWSYDAGKSVGIVTNTRVTHATPASGYAHTPHRDWETASDVPADCPQVKDIAYQLVKNNSYIQVVLGGGRRSFLNRSDNLTLTDEWLSEKSSRSVSAKYVENATQLKAVNAADTDYLLGLFSDSHMSYELDRNNTDEPSLAEMTRKAIEILSKNDKGYFLLVEGGRIDHGHHENWAKKALEETLVLENAVTTARSMTGSDTLLVVTADHSHVFDIAGYPSRGNDILGLVDKDPERPLDNKPYSTLFYSNGPGPNRQDENLTDVDTTTNDYRFEAGVSMNYETHGGEDVAIYATGPMAHLFEGVFEQNYIAHVMGYASCVGPNRDHCNGPSTTQSSDANCNTASGGMRMGPKGVMAVILMMIGMITVRVTVW